MSSAGTTTDAVWDGGDFGNSYNWSDAGNWVNDENPDGGGSSIVEFAGSVGLTPYNDYGNYTQFNEILFDSGASSFTLNGNIIKLYSGGSPVAKIENNSSSLQTVSLSSILSESNMELDATNGNMVVNSSLYADYNSGVLYFYGNAGNTLTLNGVIGQYTATRSLTCNQNGTVILAADNSYTGGTTVNSGLLLANTSGSSNSATGTGAVAVNSGAVLGGNGYIGNGSNAVAINSGGTITAGSGASAGSSIGTLTTNSQSWAGGGTYVAKVQSGTISGSTSPGTTNDYLVMSGLTISATNSSPFNISLVSQGSTTLEPNTSLVLAYSTSNFNTSDLSLQTSNVSPAAGYSIDLASVAASGGGYDLVAQDAAPEPTSMILVGLVITPLCLYRRRHSEAQAA